MIADGDAVVWEGSRRVLKQVVDLAVVSEVGGGEEATRLAGESIPGVVMPKADGIRHRSPVNEGKPGGWYIQGTLPDDRVVHRKRWSP